ncbi:MAG: ATP-binding protein, partial [Bacteroidota bacterium]
EAVTLKHYQNELSIEFVGLHFSRPEKNQYQVMLASYDEDWRAPTMERKITYTSLNPGKYTFMVRSANAYGTWSEDVQQFDIIIASPWWLRYWAFGLYLSLFAASVVLVDRYQRARLLKKEREAMQMREAELRAEAAELKFKAAESDARALKAENEQKEVELQKAEELKEAYDALKDSMKQLKVAQSQLVQAEKMASLGQLTAGIAHEIKNPLNFVVNFARISSNLMDDLKDLLQEESDRMSDASRDEIEHMLTTLTLNTERINQHGLRADSIVKNMMEHSRTSSGVQTTVSMERVLNQAIDLAYMGATEQLNGFSITIDRNFGPDLGEIKIIAQDFKRVIINILDNAFYALKEIASKRDESFQASVCISGRRTVSELEIRIKDNGPGLDEDVKAKIFNPFFTTKPPGTGNTGLGLSLSFDIITQGHNGVLAVAGEPGEGAEFIIRIPVNSSV